MPALLEIRARRAGERVTLALAGELDVVGGDELISEISRAVRPGAHIVVDLRRLAFIDPSGVDALRRCAGWAACDGWTLAITGAPPHVRRVLRLTGADTVLPLKS